MRKVPGAVHGLLLTLFLFPALALAGAGPGASLRVRVLDAGGGVLERASVALTSRDQRVRVAAVTDEAGSYGFDDLAPGEYLIEARAPGFLGSNRALLLRAGASEEITLTLDLAAIEERVTVTASGTAQSVDEVSKALTVIDRGEIELRDEVSIAEALRTVPGLRVQQLGGPGGLVSVKTRGLRSEDTAVLIDGVRFRDAGAPQGDASGFLGNLTVTDLDRVEVLRGSGSSLYGSNAIGGVIHIVTREGGGAPRGDLLFEGGSLGLVRGRAEVAGGWREDRMTYSAGISRWSVANGIDEDDEARDTSFQGRLRVRFSPTSSLSARVYANESFAKLNEGPIAAGSIPNGGIVSARPIAAGELERYEGGVPPSALVLDGANFIPSANDPDYERDGSFASALLSLESRPSDRWGWTVAYHGLVTDRTFLDGPQGISFEPSGPTRSEFEGTLHTLHARGDLAAGDRHLLTFGYELESEAFRNASVPEDPAMASTIDVGQIAQAFFLQDQIRGMGGALQASGAVRAQFFSLDTPRFEPAASAPYADALLDVPPDAVTGDGSVAYFLGRSGTKLRAHVGNGYRAPSLYERFGTFFGSFGYSVYGDPRLRPERSTSLDFGLDQQLAGGRARASASFFQTWLHRIIVFDFSGAIDPATDPFGRFGGYRRVEGGTSRGVELSLGGASAWGLRLSAAYTYTDAEAPAPDAAALEQAFAIPEHEVSLVATQRILPELHATLDVTLSGSYLSPVFDPEVFSSRTFRFDGLRRADLVLSYRRPLAGRSALRFFAKVENLFAQEYFENGFRTPGRLGYAGIGLGF